MFDESYLIQRIKDKTPYTKVDYADDSNIDLVHIDLLEPRIFIGHLGIKKQFPEDLVADGFHEIENREILLTAIQFLCQRDKLAEVRTNIKNAYHGFSPFPTDGDYSNLVFIEATMVAKTGNKAWWQEIVGLHMPQIA